MCFSAARSSKWRLFAPLRRRSAKTRKMRIPALRRGEADDGVDSRADEAVAEFSPPSDSEHRAFDPRGRILRDNIYGTIEEDVWRRDFAANGLYYNIDDFSIWDFE